MEEKASDSGGNSHAKLSKETRLKRIRKLLDDNKVRGYELLRGVYRRQEVDNSGFEPHKNFIFCDVVNEKEFSIRKGTLVSLAPKFRYGEIFYIARKQERAVLIANDSVMVYSRGSAIFSIDFETGEKTKLNPAKAL